LAVDLKENFFFRKSAVKPVSNDLFFNFKFAFACNNASAYFLVADPCFGEEGFGVLLIGL